jgi:hypothetical protein
MLLITILVTYKVPEKGTTELKVGVTESETLWGLEELLETTLGEIANDTDGNYLIISVSHTVTESNRKHIKTLKEVLEQVGYAQSCYQFVMVNPAEGVTLDSPSVICHASCLELYPEYSLFIGGCDKLFERIYRAKDKDKEIEEIIKEAEIIFTITKNKDGKS